MNRTGVDEDLNDDALAGEISLLGEVMTAATGAGRALTDPEIDVVLGLSDPAVPTV